MKKLIEDYIQRNREQIIASTLALIEIPSIAQFDQEGYPYGKSCADALNFCTTLCEAKGLITRNFDYRCMESFLNPEAAGKKILFAAHADVVPPDPECHFPPFGKTLYKDYIVGRGSVDNKAPLIAVIFALGFFKEHGISLQNRFSLLIGSNEEQGMDDIDHYLANSPPPTLALAVDDDFPVVNAQQGVIRFAVEAPASSSLLRLETKKRFWRRAADSCLLSIQDQEPLCFYGEEGNPVTQLLTHMRQNDLPLFQKKLLNDSVWSLLPGSSYPCVLSILHSRSVSLTPSEIVLTPQNKLRLCYQLTFTHEVDAAAIIDALKLLFGGRRPQFQIISQSDPYYVSESHELVTLLTDLYNLHSETDEHPYAMEGITYAGKFPFGLGFGAGNPHEVKPFLQGHGSSHHPDEAHSIQTLLHAVKIYIYAICALDDYYQRTAHS